MKLIAAASLTTAMLLSGCLNPNTMAVTTAPVSLSASQENMVKTAISELTREPEATRFRNIRGFRSSGGDLIVCGEANAKNAFGGYVGYTPMWIRSRGNEVLSAIWSEGGAAQVSQKCAAAANGQVMIDPNA